METSNFFKNNYFWMICLGIVLVIASMLFGMNGFLVILGILVLLFLPMYLILRNFDLEQDEKIFFSFFAGFGIFPLVVYVVGFLVKSLLISLIVSFVLFVLSGVGIRYWKKKKHSNINVQHEEKA